MRKMLHDVETAQQQALGEIANEPERVAGLKDPVLFLLDLLCQVDAQPSAQLEVLKVLQRVLLPCLAYSYDPRVFLDMPCNVQHSDAAASSATLSSRGNRSNVVLKAFLNALHALASKSDVRIEVIEGVVALIKEICVQSVSSIDVVMLFDFLRVGKSPVRQLLLKMQTKLMEMETTPRAIFTMQGLHGGIIAPSSQMLFSKKGYSFSCGLLLDANSTLVSLYSFRGNSGQGISAMLNGNSLVVKTHVQQGNSSQVVISFAESRRQMETTWTHLCIVHAKKMVFKDKLTVYVNGKPVQTGSLVYPDPLCMVGGHNCIGIMPTLPGLQGKVWSPTLFGSALTEAEIEKLHWLTHWKSDLSSAAAENTGLTDKSKFIFSYDARSCDAENRICHDVSGNDCHGWIEPGTNAVVTQSFVQALDSIGGCAGFLLLLLDQIPEMADFHPKHEFSMDEIAEVFGFVAAGLKASLACRSHFVRLNGIKVLAFVLQSISPSYLSVDLLDGVTKILEALVDSVPQSVAVEYINLLLFLNTSWYLSPFDTQGKLLADVLPKHLRAIQERRLGGKQQTNSHSSSSSHPSAGASRAVNAVADSEPTEEADVRFFCNLLVQVYSPHSREATSVEPMNDIQLEFLRKLIIHNLIDRLLFPVMPDASIDQWRQLVVYIQQRSFAMASSEVEGGAKDSIELKEIVRYLTQILTSDNQANTSQVTSARQMMTSKISKLSEGTLRLWWRPMMSTSENVRTEALKLFEAYTLDKILLRKRDMLMMYSSLQAHPVTMPIAEVLIDIVIGKKRLGYFGNTANTPGFPMAAEGGSRSVNVARQDFVPLVLLGLLQHAEFDVQAHILLEIKGQLSSPISGETLKESIRSWPPWLSRLRAASAKASESFKASELERQTAESELEPWLQEKLILLNDESAPVSSRLEAIQEISDGDKRGFWYILSIFQNTDQPASITKAMTALIRQRLPEQCHVLVHKTANQVIVDIVVYSILYVRNGWMHFLEFYFYHFRKPSDLVALSAAICDRILAKVWQKDISNFIEIEILWENICQVAAILAQCQIVAQQQGFEKHAVLSTKQQRALMHKAFELWLVVLPHLHQVSWSDLKDHLASHANYGEDVTAEEKEIFCNLVAPCSRSRFLALHSGIECIRLSQQVNECSTSLVGGLRKVLEHLRLIPQSRAPESHGDGARAAVKTATRPSRSNSASFQLAASSAANKAVIGPMFANSAMFFEPKEDDTLAEQHEQKELIHLYVLETCFELLREELAVPNSFSTSYSIVAIMVAAASSALLLQSDSALPELSKTLQIISSTDLTFFHESSQLEDFFTLWQLHREIHQCCCDPVLFQRQVDILHEPFLHRWGAHVHQNTTDFNPYLTQKHASIQAELLGQEIHSCEALWKQIADDNAAAMMGTENDGEDESRLSSLKEDVEKFASSVHKLICHTSNELVSPSDASTLSATMTELTPSVERRRVNDGFLLKVDSKENSLRMHLRLKKVRENYRLRNLSCEYAASSFQDTESRGSGELGRRLFRGSRNGGVNASEMEQSWQSDAGSDYSDFLADAHMRAAIIRSCSNVDIRNSEYEVHSDDDDLGDEDTQFYDANDEDDNVSDEVREVLQFYASNEDASAEEFASDGQAGGTSHSSNSKSTQEPTPIRSLPPSSASPPASSNVNSAPSSTSSLSAFASVLSVVGGVAGLVQKAAKDAKDAVEFGVDSLYTAKDALTDEAQSLMDEVSTYMEGNDGDEAPASASSGSGSPNGKASPLAVRVSHDKRMGSPVLFPPSPVIDIEAKTKEKDASASDKSRSLARSSSSSSKQDQVISAKLVRHMHVVAGALVLSESALVFIPERVIDEHDNVLVEKKKGTAVDKVWRFLFKRRRWMLDDITNLNRRRYLLKSTALEIFVHSTQRNYFFNLSQEDLSLFHEALMARRPLLLKRDPAMRRLRHPSSIFRNSNMSTRWVNHEISTFEYLMWLNTIAGRTYNDLTQYPVFPWVIADYESPILDLSRQSTFRNLTKPIGALDSTRLKFYLDRYNAFEDPDVPKFM